ncbi:TlpA disulfide reductase family protein [Terrilactibacillus sp. S3-3]|nr:TlpA disulfide reductase family protein [Terrilactibacillus sp. S3-3]
MNKKIIITVILLALIGLATVSLVHDIAIHRDNQEKQTGKKAKVVRNTLQTAPAIKLASNNGKVIQLSDFHGRTVLVTTWTTWCRECGKELETLNELSRQYSPDKLNVLAVNMTSEEASLAAVQRFLKQKSYSFPVLFDTNGQVKKDYAVYAIPQSFLIDPYGKIIHSFQGNVTKDEIGNWLP